MCGLAGIVLPRGSAFDAADLTAMGDAIRHRGPDDFGALGWNGSGRMWVTQDISELVGRNLGMVHRRLSILDLSEAGRQPMCSPDGRYAIVFNGEIYNYLELRGELETAGYIFRTGTDTEVLLSAFAAWGRSALTKLIGMFALAVLDTVENQLFMARDPFGIKPLFYMVHSGCLLFASEIKALLAVSGVEARACPQRIYEYLRFGLSDRGGPTMFEGIEQLPPAHFAEVSLDAPTRILAQRYWKPMLGEAQDISFEEASQRLRDMFLNSVSLHLRSDVPVGVALSGGIDSSAIAMAIREVNGQDQELHTFSYIADDPALSEEGYADVVGRAANAIMHKVRPRADDLARDLEYLIGVQDEPFISTSMYATMRVYRLAHEHGIKVTLDGQGADEYLAGYPTYTATRMASLVRQGEWGRALNFLREAPLAQGSARAGFLMRVGRDLLPEELHAAVRGLSGNSLFPGWINGRWFAAHGVGGIEHLRVEGPMLHRVLIETLHDRSLPALLRYADRNAMTNSVESRLPFLTPELVSFVFSLPESYILSDRGETKSLFRSAMRGIVPDRILDRRDKVGFVTPQGSWFNDLRGIIDGIIDTAVAVPAIDVKTVKGEWSKWLADQRQPTEHIWRCINVLLWARRYDVSFG